MIDLAVFRIIVSLWTLADVIDDGEESVGVDFFGSDLLPVQDVLACIRGISTWKVDVLLLQAKEVQDR